MTPRAAANRSPPKRPAAKQSMRFSLRSLFLVSVTIALPLLMLANLRGNRRLEDSLGSPVSQRLSHPRPSVARWDTRWGPSRPRSLRGWHGLRW
jgi:hypothetical protein